MNHSPFVIENMNLSQAWVYSLKKICCTAGSEITPLVITITDFNESTDIRDILNTSLSQNKLPSIDTVSETIFPTSLYEYVKCERSELYKVYKKNLPRIKKIDVTNANGTYFERLISFDCDKQINQLEIIVTSLINNTIKRRSKLQAAVFDPRYDHTNKTRQGFPCLQHITFYKSENGGLIMNSFYAIQYLYRRGYGNWLGLINLGKFIAKEAKLKLERFNCFIGIEHLDHLNKTEAKQLLLKMPTIPQP